MTDGRGSRILPILAAVLAFLGLAVTVILLLYKSPIDVHFDEALTSADFAAESGSNAALRRELLKASRHAVSAAQWKQILSIAAAAIPLDSQEKDYKLISVLSGRAASSLPGDQDIIALWCWSALRRGDLKRASAAADALDGSWGPIVAEVRLKEALGSSDEDLESFLNTLKGPADPEFLAMAAGLTGSAELAMDAALAYMLYGRPLEAYVLAGDVMGGKMRWNEPHAAQRHGAYYTAACIAQDAGDTDMAIEWLESGLEEDLRRRAESWESLQLLGDLKWDRFILRGRISDRSGAEESWLAAMGLVMETGDKEDAPFDAWRLWVNMAVLQESKGRVRASRVMLEEALALYPGVSEVKASWAMEMRNEEPALARRLVSDAYAEENDPLLGISTLQLDPESVSPRLYESRLWGLFDDVTDPENEYHRTNGRIVVTFLLNYMASRRNYSSIDVAVDRYRKVNPDDDWILSWRLAADASRRISGLNLVPSEPGGMSAYHEYLNAAMESKSWRALHDSAMFALVAADELSSSRERFVYQGYSTDSADSEMFDEAMLALLKVQGQKSYVMGTPIGDRIDVLLKMRTDWEDFNKALGSSGNKGRTARNNAIASIDAGIDALLNDALAALDEALIYARELSGADEAALKYLKALVYRRLGRNAESVETAREALAADPSNARARELTELEENA